MSSEPPQRRIIFDFDGTIADTITFGFSRLDAYASELGLPSLSDDERAELRSLSYQEIIAQYKIPLWKVPRLLLRMRSEIRTVISQIDPFPGIPSLLSTLHTKGYRTSILTSNERSLVEQFLNAHQIHGIEDIYSETNLFRKAYALRRFLTLQKLTPEQILYVGDEVRDIEACHRAKVPIISVSWGFNTGPVLAQHRPLAVVHTPEELLQKILAVSETSRLVPNDTKDS